MKLTIDGYQGFMLSMLDDQYEVALHQKSLEECFPDLKMLRARMEAIKIATDYNPNHETIKSMNIHVNGIDLNGKGTISLETEFNRTQAMIDIIEQKLINAGLDPKDFV